jgi:hypothetical protein
MNRRLWFEAIDNLNQCVSFINDLLDTTENSFESFFLIKEVSPEEFVLVTGDVKEHGKPPENLNLHLCNSPEHLSGPLPYVTFTPTPFYEPQ